MKNFCISTLATVIANADVKFNGEVRIFERDGRLQVECNGTAFPWPKGLDLYLSSEAADQIRDHFRYLREQQEEEPEPAPAPKALSSAFARTAEREELLLNTVGGPVDLGATMRLIAREEVAEVELPTTKTLEKMAREITTQEMDIRKLALSKYIADSADKAVDSSIRRNMEMGTLTSYIKEQVKAEVNMPGKDELAKQLQDALAKEVTDQMDITANVFAHRMAASADKAVVDAIELHVDNDAFAQRMTMRADKVIADLVQVHKQDLLGTPSLAEFVKMKVAEELDRRDKDLAAKKEMPDDLKERLKMVGEHVESFIGSIKGGPISMEQSRQVVNQIIAMLRSWVGEEVKAFTLADMEPGNTEEPKLFVQSYMSVDARHTNIEIVGKWSDYLGIPTRYIFALAKKEAK
jgi:hypothetical protein